MGVGKTKVMGKTKVIGNTEKHAITITFTFFRLEIVFYYFLIQVIIDEEDNNPGSQNHFHFRYVETWQTV